MNNEKEQPVQQEPPLVININLTRGLLVLLALVLVAVACLGYLAWGQKAVSAGAQAAPVMFNGKRQYYVTQSSVDGNEALTACATGYHMASLWEIMDASQVEYNSGLGYARNDSGAGPPTYIGIWVRTGWDSEGDSGIAGHDNCYAWTSDGSGDTGTTAWLPDDWTGGLEDMHVWGVNDVACNSLKKVWCVED